MASAVDVGDIAPDFTLEDQNGSQVRLSGFRGQKSVVLFFYPKDFSPVCTLEAVAFRDAYAQFVERGAEVIGVSADSSSSHAKFCGSYDLPFPLLTDTDQQVRKMYNSQGLFGRYSHRVTFVIDPQGIVKAKYSANLKSAAHVEMALKTLDK